MTKSPATALGLTNLPLAPDFGAKTFEGVAVPLYDLFVHAVRSRETRIEGRTFKNCRIEGPAVMLPTGACTFDATDFGHTGGDIRSLVLRPVSPNTVVGAIPIHACAFVGCQFVWVGFTGDEAFINQILALGTTKP